MKKKILVIFLSLLIVLSTIGGVALAAQAPADTSASRPTILQDSNENTNEQERETENRNTNAAKGELTLRANITALTTENITITGIVIWLTPKTNTRGTLAVGASVKLEASYNGEKWVAKSIKAQKTTTTPTPPATTAPAAPSNITATSASATHINIYWVDNANNETGFRVQRATVNSFTSGLTNFTVSANVTTYADTTVSPSTTYYYRVIAFNTVGDSAPTGVISATTPAPATTVPAGASGLSATAPSYNVVNLTWTDNAVNETGIRVQRATNNTFTTGLSSTTLVPNASSYTDNAVTANSTYYYRVIAFNAAGDATPSNTATITTPSAPLTIDAAAVFAANCTACHGIPSTSKTQAQLIPFISSHNTGNSLTAAQVNAIAAWLKP
ncbi:MAG: fibronectin type III domain-containing protein [Dehalococcoidales bacterium]|nr:fibronectin type III domain-containing protein [Dehalococcoidales bacterium]